MRSQCDDEAKAAVPEPIGITVPMLASVETSTSIPYCCGPKSIRHHRSSYALAWRAHRGLRFLFVTPWAWLIDHDWFGRINDRWLETLTTYLLILWIPALLYSGCFWLLFRALRLRRGHGVNECNGLI
jgi:hypothetical protein